MIKGASQDLASAEISDSKQKAGFAPRQASM
jgi:hypothetical protein